MKTIKKEARGTGRFVYILCTWALSKQVTDILRNTWVYVKFLIKVEEEKQSLYVVFLKLSGLHAVTWVVTMLD